MGPDTMDQGLAGKSLGSGMAGQAARTLQNLPYQRHLQEAKAMGEQPMSAQQFQQQQSGR